ncbi:MAG TPA: MJ0042-type zinc finger domain-containing protein [Pseudolabrys sp.]|nr:MJ0042-type zinc finger domain-containing protein [Pseudolabrys sp.]
MLIVCPSCSTSYTVEQGSLGPAGRTVRCARCKSTWFAGGANAAEPDLDAFVDRAIAEAQVQPEQSLESPPLVQSDEPASAAPEGAPAGDARDAPPASPAEPQQAGGMADQAGDNAGIPSDISPMPIADAPSLVPPNEPEPLHDPAPADTSVAEQEDIESFAARRERLQAKRKQSQSRSRWSALILVLLAFNVALVFARDDVVRYLPQTASFFAMIGLPVNLRHLAFEDVKVSREAADGTPVLVIDGRIVSRSQRSIAVPRLRFAARSAKGQELYTWTALPGRSLLPPGASLPFQSRLASPPKEAADIMVRFFNSRDEMAAAK